MKKGKKHIACKVGDHTGNPPRDVAPDKTTLTFFEEDGAAWMALDVESRLIDAVREIARRERVSVNRLLSAAFVEELTRKMEEGLL